MKSLMCDLLLLMGLALVGYGVWRISPDALLFYAGFICVALAVGFRFMLTQKDSKRC